MNPSHINFKKVEPITTISHLTEGISIHSPIHISITKIIQYNEQQKFLTVILVDQVGEQILGFLYGDIGLLLSNSIMLSYLPIKISIFK